IPLPVLSAMEIIRSSASCALNETEPLELLLLLLHFRGWSRIALLLLLLTGFVPLLLLLLLVLFLLSRLLLVMYRFLSSCHCIVDYVLSSRSSFVTRSLPLFG